MLLDNCRSLWSNTLFRDIDTHFPASFLGLHFLSQAFLDVIFNHYRRLSYNMKIIHLIA